MSYCFSFSCFLFSRCFYCLVVLTLFSTHIMRVQSIARLLQESLQGVRDAMDFWERWVAAGQQRLWSGATGVPPMRAAGVPPMPEPRQSPSRSRSPSHAPPRPSAPPAPEPRPSAPPSAPWDQKWLRVPPASPALGMARAMAKPWPGHGRPWLTYLCIY